MSVKFDSRKKKPKLFQLAVMTAIMVLILFPLVQSRDPEKMKWASLLLSAHFALTVILLADTFRKQLEYNPYSYNTIIYSGFAIFFIYVAAVWIYLTIRCFLEGASITDRHLLFLLLNSAKNFLTLLAPFLLIFAGGLLISNLELICHEGFRFVNVLGMILAVLLVSGEVLLYYLNGWLITLTGSRIISDLAISLFSAFYLYFECMLTGTIIANIIAALHQADMGREGLIVLGCGLMEDGTPTPLLRGRLDLAKRFHDEQLCKTGKNAVFVVSGGQGPDETQSEAASMKAYLLTQGIPEESIFLEDRSNDTAENMRYSKEIFDRILPGACPVFFTTNYHVFRAGLKARRVKMRAVGMGAPTKWYFWPNASIREFVGLLTEHKLKQGLVLFFLVLFYILLTFLVYR